MSDMVELSELGEETVEVGRYRALEGDRVLFLCGCGSSAVLVDELLDRGNVFVVAERFVEMVEALEFVGRYLEAVGRFDVSPMAEGGVELIRWLMKPDELELLGESARPW